MSDYMFYRNILKNKSESFSVLSDRQGQLAKAYYVDQRTMRDIAKDLGVNVSTVSRTLSLARDRLDNMR